MVHRIRTLSTWIVWFFLSAAVICAADPLQEVDQTAGEYIKLRVETARVQTEWQSQRALVESLVAALQDRATAAEEQRDLTRAKTAKEREELEAMRAKNQVAADDLKDFEVRLKGLSGKLIALRPSLPPLLADALEMSYRTLAGSEASPGERMQVAMNVLNRCAQFNRTVSVGEDALTLDGEPPRKSFEVIYWGLSHGYAVDRSAGKVWLGAPGPSGWRWEPQPEAFDAVVRLIDIAGDKADPAFVSVPARSARLVATEKGTP